MSSPGYAYIVGRTTADGEWVKVGIAARIGRVLDHRGWNMLVRTFEAESVLADPRELEQRVLSRFPEFSSNRAICGSCGVAKPPIGRTGSDGLTEIRHATCYPGIREFFEQEWNSAKRLPRDSAWRVDFNPLSLRPAGMKVAGHPWRQPPRMDASDYQSNTCNVLCIRGVPSEEVLSFLDRKWEEGTPDLRAALWAKYGKRVCKRDGTPTPRAKGSGASGRREDVESKLTDMAVLLDVSIVLVSVRKPGMLYAYA